MEILFTMEALIAFLTLTFLEIVLGIDNVILFRSSQENFLKVKERELRK